MKSVRSSAANLRKLNNEKLRSISAVVFDAYVVVCVDEDDKDSDFVPASASAKRKNAQNWIVETGWKANIKKSSMFEKA